jgi:hypothetical protein
MQHGIEAICVRKGIGVAFVELEAGAEEFGAVGGGYYGAGGGGAEDALDVVEGGDDFLAEGAVKSVFWRGGEGYDENVAFSAEVEFGKSRGGWCGGGHVGRRGVVEMKMKEAGEKLAVRVVEVRKEVLIYSCNCFISLRVQKGESDMSCSWYAWPRLAKCGVCGVTKGSEAGAANRRIAEIAAREHDFGHLTPIEPLL